MLAVELGQDGKGSACQPRAPYLAERFWRLAAHSGTNTAIGAILPRDPHRLLGILIASKARRLRERDGNRRRAIAQLERLGQLTLKLLRRRPGEAFVV